MLAGTWSDRLHRAKIQIIFEMSLNVHNRVKFLCRPQIWIPEIKYYKKLFSHDQILPKELRKQLSKINVVVVGGMKPNTETTHNISCVILALCLLHYS